VRLPTQAVVLCGGLGTRLLPHTATCPKPMIDCDGKPFLWYLLNQISEEGPTRFLLLTGYMSEVIVDYFGDGDRFGWTIEYSNGPLGWDTGRRIWEAKGLIDPSFLLLYSDNFTTFSLSKLTDAHFKSGKSLTLTVIKKSPGNIGIDINGDVDKYAVERSRALEYVEIGYMVVNKNKMLSSYTEKDCNFSEIIGNLVSQNDCNALIQLDQYHSVSDPDRWLLTRKYLSNKKIILIDRDGVINEKADQGCYITKWKDFKWIEDTVESMVKLSDCGFSFIVITNQACIGRKLATQDQVEEIHANMLTFFNEKKIRVIKVYMCPHHWIDECDCRKPKPGMLLKASADYLFRLDKTIYIGDDPRDFEAANRVGCASIIIGNRGDGLESSDHVDCYSTLLSSIDFIKRRLL